jgi:hypothetical protein
MKLSKFPALVCWTASAGVSLSSAYLNGAQGSVLPGIGTAVAVVGGMAVPHWALESFRVRERVWATILSPIAALLVVYALAQSAGYMSTVRGDAAQAKETAIENHAQAATDVADWKADLARAKGTQLWSDTAACTVTAGRKQKDFCAHVSELDANIKEAKGVTAIAAPASKDALADNLSWATMGTVPPATFSRAMPMLLAVCVELIGIVSFHKLMSSVQNEQPPPAETSNPLPDIAADIAERLLRARFESEQAEKVAAEKAAAKKAKAKEYRVRAKVKAEAKAKKPKRRKRKRKPPSPPALRIVK